MNSKTLAVRSYARWALSLSLFLVGCSSSADRTAPSSETSDARTGGDADTGGTAAEAGADSTAPPADACRSASRPTSEVGRLVAAQRPPDSGRLDGRLDEYAPRLFSFEGPSGTGNRVEVAAAWNEQALFVAAKITDDQTSRDESAAPWQNDSFEVALSPDTSSNPALDSGDYKWIVGPGDIRRTSRGEEGHWVPRSEDPTRSRVRTTDGGFTVELEIPWSAIGGESPADRSLIVEIANNDRDGDDVRRFTWSGAADRLANPGQWGRLLLRESSACAPNNDTGVPDGNSDADTGRSGDASDGGDAGVEPRLGPPHYLTESDFQFDTRLHAVEDLGMDPTGQEPIDDQLDEARATHGSHTLIVFPPGEYRVEAGPDRSPKHFWNDDVNHFGMKGLGEKPKDVQFVVEQQPPNYGGRWIQVEGGRGTFMKNFSIQMTDDRYTSADIVIRRDDLVLLEKIEWLGLTPSDDHGLTGLLTVKITSRDGVGELNRIYMRQGSVMPDYPDGMVGIRMGVGHVGTLYMTDLWLEQRSSSAFRFSHPSGRVGVEGGFFKNNANTNLRGGAGDHPDGPSYIRGATVVVDEDDMNQYQPDNEPLTTTEALRIDSTGHAWSGFIVENVDIYYLDAPSGRGVVSRPAFGDHGAATLRNVRVQNETATPTTTIQDVSKPSDETIRIEDSQFTGSGSGALEADAASSAEIVDSCVSSNFEIRDYDVENNVSRSGCTPPDAPQSPPSSP